MNTLDIVVIVVIGISVINGAIRGFIRTLFGLSSLLVAVILTWMLTPVVSDAVIEQSSFDEMISEQVVELLDIEHMINMRMEDSDAVREISGLKLPGNMIESLADNYTPQVLERLNVTGVGDYIGDAISVMSVNALVYIVMFVVISIALNAIVTLLDLVSRLPVLNQMNRIGGIGLGLMIGVVCVWLGSVGLSFIISIQSTTMLSEMIEKSILMKIFYYNNPLQSFIMSVGRIL